MGGILCPRGHGEEGISMYEYDISGKISLKSKYKEMKIDMKEMIKFILTTFFSACKLKLYSSNGKGRGKEGKI